MANRSLTEVIQSVLDRYKHPYTVVRIDEDAHEVFIRPSPEVISSHVEAVLPDHPEAEITDWDDRNAPTGPGTPTYVHAEDTAAAWNLAATDEALPEAQEFAVWDALDDAGLGGVRPTFSFALTAEDLLPTYRMLRSAHHATSGM